MTAIAIAAGRSTRSATRQAVADMLPLAVAVVPFGTVIGVTLDQARIAALPAIAATALLYGGSAQLATLSVIIAGGGPIGAIVAGALVNARLTLYSAGLGTRFRSQPTWFRWIAPLTTVDQTFALATAAEDLHGAEFRRYWIVLGTVLGAIWLAAVGVGIGLGGAFPEHSPLEIAAPATLISLLVPHLIHRRTLRVVAVAGVVALLCRTLPAGLGIMLGIVAGLVVSEPLAGAEDDLDAPADEHADPIETGMVGR